MSWGNAAQDLGVGPVYGTIWDRVLNRAVLLRTPLDFVLRWGRGYAADMSHLSPVRGWWGNQYGWDRGDEVHNGEDLYFPASTRILAPFSCEVLSTFVARRTGDWGHAVVLQALVDPRIVVYLVHLWGDLPEKGARLYEGELVGFSYAKPVFPNQDPSHVHVEGYVLNEARHPLSVLNASKLVEP